MAHVLIIFLAIRWSVLVRDENLMIDRIQRDYWAKKQKRLSQVLEKRATRVGFEPTRAEHIGLAVQRLNHSAISSHDVILVDQASLWLETAGLRQTTNQIFSVHCVPW